MMSISASNPTGFATESLRVYRTVTNCLSWITVSLAISQQLPIDAKQQHGR